MTYIGVYTPSLFWVPLTYIIKLRPTSNSNESKRSNVILYHFYKPVFGIRSTYLVIYVIVAVNVYNNVLIIRQQTCIGQEPYVNTIFTFTTLFSKVDDFKILTPYKPIMLFSENKAYLVRSVG